MGKYDDIINMPHPEPQGHQRMPIQNRAAQFAPFAALSGHTDALIETARLTEARIDLSDEERKYIAANLQKAIDNHALCVSVAYFIPDKTKKGGRYMSHTGHIRKIDEYSSTLILSDGTTIPLDDITAVTIRH